MSVLLRAHSHSSGVLEVLHFATKASMGIVERALDRGRKRGGAVPRNKSHLGKNSYLGV